MHPDSKPSNKDDDDLPPPGTRWGVGTRSILPHLNKSLRAKPADHGEAHAPRSTSAHPVFADGVAKKHR